MRIILFFCSLILALSLLAGLNQSFAQSAKNAGHDKEQAISTRFIQEVRLGVLAHNTGFSINSMSANQEDGVNVQGEIIFKRPKFLDKAYLWRPDPYIMASVNTVGDTSYGGFGLKWDKMFGKRQAWFAEGGLGYVLHNGQIDIPFPLGDPRNKSYDENNILFGSRDLFRLTLAVGRKLSPNWSAHIAYEHLSHGYILGSKRNQGNNSLGLRLAYHFSAGH